MNLRWGILLKESRPSTKLLRDTRSSRPLSAVWGVLVERSAGTPAKVPVPGKVAQGGILARETVAVVEPLPGDLTR